MKKQLIGTIIIISIPFIITSCVSTLLQEKAPTFSKEIQYNAPQSNFIKTTKSVYPAWKNQKTGNVISLVSDCNESVTLTNLQQLIYDSVESAKLIKQNQISFQNKPAISTVTEGQLDGQNIIVYSLAFKRKNCGYISSLSGKPDHVEKDKNYFDQFNESFRFE